MKYSYPNLRTVKEFCPNSYIFRQVDFFAFSFANDILKLFISSEEFLINVRYFILLLLMLLIIILFFIYNIILSYIIKKVIKPIIDLSELINLNYNDDIKKNNDIFEYELDEDINKFFKFCKKIINGEIKNKNKMIKNNKNLENNININNNMIINNKMISEIIENQKSLNNEEKEIYLLKEINSKNNINKKYINKKTEIYSEKSSNFHRFSNLNIINKNSSKNNNIQLFNIGNESNSEKSEDELQLNDLKYYEYLLELTEYIYNEKDKGNKKTKNYIKHTSSNSLTKLNNFELMTNNKNNVKNIGKDCKYITYYWYMNAKKDKSFKDFENISS